MFPKSSSDFSLTDFEEKTSKTQDDVETIVGPSVKVEGDFASEGNIVVKGVVSGSVRTSKMLTVEDGAKIFANVNAGTAVISGGIKGNVKVNDRLDLTKSAQIQGDVICKVLTVEPGALIHGKITMKGVDLVDNSVRSEKKRILGRVKTSEEKIEE